MVGGTVEDIINPNLKKFRGLYAMRDTEESQWQEKKQHIHDFGNLSLFRDMESESEHSVGHQDAERPITPINESIKTAPKSYGSLSKLILRRIHPRPEWSHISLEDQSSLGAVIMGEVNAAWPLLRKQVSDPFLTHQQNRELQRRISVHCVTVCEHMFLHYAEKVKTLNSKGVFTNSANMSRIRAQLALETGKYLNILSVRRYIIADLKKPPLKEKITFSREKVTRSPTTPLSAPSPKRLSFRKLIKSSRPSRKFKYQFNLNAEIQNMQAMMPSISLSKVQQIQSLIDKSQALMQSETEEEYVEDKETLEFGEEELETKKKMDAMSDSSLPRFLRQRYPSEPLIQHTLLLDEMLQIEKEEEDYLLMRSPSQAPESHFDLPPNTPISLRESNQILSQSSLGLATVPPPDLASIDIKDPKEDLKLLVAKEERRKRKEKAEADAGKVDEESDDLPPLIQAITRRQIQDENLRQLQKKEVELDKKSEEDLKKKMKPLPPPQHPQPAIIQHKLPGSSNPVTRTPFTIRASDVKINDQVDLSAVTLQSYLPVYNDLTGDISQATVKELDANLFQGGELREVYSEIMKTVPNIHQQYDNDPLIMPPASNVDLSKILASSTLVRPRSQQVINPKLKKDDFDMPWEGQQLNWQKGSMRPHSAFQDSDVTSMSQGHGEGYTAFHRFTPSQLNHPGIEKGSRAYASWLQWWKNTINSDDFFKYLSTQDTDFLSVIFHFYDSDFGDSELESMRTAKMESQREREKKLAILKKEKEEFVPGFWNTKTVTLGGLGKDPEIEEENDFSDFETPQSTNRSQPLLESEARSSSATPRISLGRTVKCHRRTIRFSKSTHTSLDSGGSDLTDSASSNSNKDDESNMSSYHSFVSRSCRDSKGKKFAQARLSHTVGCNQLQPVVKKYEGKHTEKKSYSNDHKLLSWKLDQSEFTGDEASTSGYCSGSVVDNTTDGNQSISLKLKGQKKPTLHSLSSKARAASSLNEEPNGKRGERKYSSVKSVTLAKTYNNEQIARIFAECAKLGRSSSSPRGTTFSSPRNKSNLTESQHSKQESEQEISIQERLEIVWRKLRMPDSQKLNCALKYSSDEYIKRLPEIVSSWERVTDAILRREALMTNLEMFEKEASDPNRFFEKGQKGSSAARLSEAKTRATLYKKLEALEMIIKASLASIKSRYSDTITFDGRPYMEKMDSDKIEMLYYLQQERRCIMLKDHGHSESLEAFLGHGQARVMGVLPPINKRFNQIPVSNVCLSVPE